MKRNCYTLFLVFLFSLISNGYGQISFDVPCQKSTEGTDFWFGFMEGRYHSINHYVEVTVTSRFNCRVNVYIGKSTTPRIYQLQANSSEQIDIDWSLVEAIGSETIQDKAIHITATKPINVYALNFDRNSADVAVIYPTSSLDYEYLTACYTPNVRINNSGNFTGRNSEFLVVATENSTAVKIVPSVQTDRLVPAGDTIVFTLDKGEVYQVQSANRSGLTLQGDLTGSFVKSDKPVAVFSGSYATTVPLQHTAWDHLYEQVPPVNSYGRTYVTVPLRGRYGDRFRAIASRDSTKIEIAASNTTVYINRGDYYEFYLSNNQPSLVRSTKPIMLVQYSQSNSADAATDGDPFMIVLSPVNQLKNKVTFVAYDSDQIRQYNINVITKSSNIANITLDGVNQALQFNNLPGTQYSYAQLSTTRGEHELESLDTNQGFIAYVYGFGGIESYGYGVGFNLDIVMEITSDVGFEEDTIIQCNSAEVKLYATEYFDEILWSTGDTTYGITVDQPGTYWAVGRDSEGCVSTDSVLIIQSFVEVELGKDIAICQGDSHVISIPDTFALQYWSTGDTSTSITVDSAGVYAVNVENDDGCKTSDFMNIMVHDKPQVNLVADSLFCDIFTEDIKVEISNTDSVEWNFPGASNWTSNKASALFENVTNTSARVNALIDGTYQIYYEIVTVNGCIGNDTIAMGFYSKPDADFEITSPALDDPCVDYERIVTLTNSYDTLSNYDWDLDGCHNLGAISLESFRISGGANIPTRTIGLTTERYGCISEQARSFTMDPTFEFWAQPNTGCGELETQFYGRDFVDDPVEYLWTFHDDNSTSSSSSPMHFYGDTGSYDVTLKITNQHNGCVGIFTQENMVRVWGIPIAKMDALEDSCYGTTAEFTSIGANLNSVFDWYTSGNQLLQQYQNKALYNLENNAQSQVGLTIQENGCISDTLWQKVKRKPIIAISISDTLGCPPLISTLTCTSNDEGLLYFWNIDTLDLSLQGKTWDYTFKNSGEYMIEVNALSMETGCESSIKANEKVIVYPASIPRFVPSDSIATIEHPTIYFINYSENTVEHWWYFSDEDSTNVLEPTRTFDTIGVYEVQLMGISEKGCVDTFIKTIRITPFDIIVPNAFRPDSHIEQNRVFKPVIVGVESEPYHLVIYNKWGRAIFESRKLEHVWNGTLRDGNKAPTGLYVWTLEYYDVQGYRHVGKGTVMLVR